MATCNGALGNDGVIVPRFGSLKPENLKSGRLARLLATAVKFWLRTQVEAAETLEVAVGGSGRELLSGCLPSVQVWATGVVYQGLALQDVAIAASAIRINLSQVLRGKPLQLLEPIAIDLVQTINADNLNRSIAAPLLAQAIADFVKPLLAGCEGAQFMPQNLMLGEQSLSLRGQFSEAEGDRSYPLTLTTGLALSSPQQLQFQNPQWTQDAAAAIALPALDSFAMDLGSDVAFRMLAIAPDKIHCEGTLTVRP
ncbi:MAG: DUF2993 domain-containing protein [Cyanobacteria bacterium P01_D01_bin.73]